MYVFKKAVLRDLLKITEFIFKDVILRQKNCLQYLKSTQKMFIVNSVGKIMGLFFFFTFVTLATFKAIFNNNNF